MILCSACLLGVKCRYNGSAKTHKDVIKLTQKETLLPVCPEQMGGLPTPREYSEKRNGKVITSRGRDVSKQFMRGARETLKLAQRFSIKTAVLKKRSPSCGSGVIYDGTFSGKTVKGDGVTVALLKKHNIMVFPEDKIKTLLSIILIFLLLLFSVLPGNADVIYLKNKRKLEGIIREKTRTNIILDVGFGNVSISKDEIDRIEDETQELDKKMRENWQKRSGELENEEKEVTLITDLETEFTIIREKRAEAVRYREQLVKYASQIHALEQELSGLYAKYEYLNNKLMEADKNNVTDNNKLIAEINAVHAKIVSRSKESEKLKTQKETLDYTASKLYSEYHRTLSTLSRKLDEAYVHSKEHTTSDPDETFYTHAQEEIRELKKDFIYNKAAISRNTNGILVEATLNNRITATLVVDTGASILLISRKIADRLRIPDDQGESRKLKCTLADGSTAWAVPIVLESVEVGSTIVRNVSAAIMEKPPSPGVDGLLGMSFLGNFNIKIDSKRNELILEEFKPM